MAKYKRQKVKRYRRSFYSRGTRIKKGIGIVVLVLAVLGAAWLAAPHVLDWATHTWYTVVKNRDLEAESASRAAASSEAAASSAVQEAASSQPEPEQPKELDGKAVTGGSWAAVDVSTLADDAAILHDNGSHLRVRVSPASTTRCQFERTRHVTFMLVRALRIFTGRIRLFVLAHKKHLLISTASDLFLGHYRPSSSELLTQEGVVHDRTSQTCKHIRSCCHEKSPET